jgi:hypothetical protein
MILGSWSIAQSHSGRSEVLKRVVGIHFSESDELEQFKVTTIIGENKKPARGVSGPLTKTKTHEKTK